jgi:hypothetical protein
MHAKIYLLFPFDMGLELDFTGKDAKEIFKEISARKMGGLSFEDKTFNKTEFSTQVYRFGVGMSQISVEMEQESDLEFLAKLSCAVEKVQVGKVGVLPYCESFVTGLIQRAEKYAAYRYERRLTDLEVFPVFELTEQPTEDTHAFVTDNQKILFGLLAGEPNYEALSHFVLEHDRLVNFGYYEKDIILIKRFGALIYSQESPGILEMIKLAYAQYWSMRSYNYFLDHELETSQKLMENLPPYYKFWQILQAYQRFSKEALDFDRDKISIVDSLYNVVPNVPQVDSDWHLRTVHKNVDKVFDIEGLHKTVEIKIERIAESYNSAREFLSTNFFILLDIIFFLSLIWSIIDTFLLWKLSVK